MNLTEPTTPLHNADQGGSFFIWRKIKLDPSEIHIKEPKTYEQQLQILRERNLVIDDTNDALSFLKRVNYYRFSAYGLTLKQDDNKDLFQDGVSFFQMKMIYNFDQKLRDLLMNYLELIEIEFRSKIAYHHAHRFGPLGYRNSDTFKRSDAHKMFLVELNKQINRSGRELFVMHHRSKYQGEFPFWVAIEVISFGELSKLYKNLTQEIKTEVLCDFNIPSFYAESWLHTLAYIRNVCAHYGRIYGKELVIKPKLFKSKRKTFEANRIFSVIFLLSKLLHQEDCINFITTLQALLEEYSEHINLKELGFFEEWEKLIL